jgi:hypothetical protein
MTESRQPNALNLELPRRDGIGKLPSTVSLIVGVLLFLLPFAEVKCNGNTLVDNTGLGMATGGEWKVSEKGLFGTDFFEGEVGKNMNSSNRRQDPNIFAIIALGMGILGVVFSFINNRGGITAVMVSSFIALGAMIALFIDIKDKSKLAAGEYPGDIHKVQMKITVDFTPWFYITCILFLLVAVLSMRRLQSRT